MFDFTHLREITEKMQVESLTYAENFWQKIFDSLEFNEKHPIEEICTLIVGNSEFGFPDKADPLGLFQGLTLEINYSYFGDISIEIIWDDDNTDDEPCDRILRDALLKNRFVMHRSNENLYSYNINQT